MDAAAAILVKEGVCRFDPVFDAGEIVAINAAMDTYFVRRADEARSYIWPEELEAIGLIDTIFKPALRDILFAIMPDPVLYHLHAYEIAANSTKSHIFGDNMSGFHADADSEWHRNEATHISLFLYLTDVDDLEDGPFELVMRRPSGILTPGARVASMTGAAGSIFAFNRSYFHRAAPNRGPVRRRLLKLSIQPNRFPSTHLSNEHFTALKAMRPAGQDVQMDLLLGRFEGKEAPRYAPRALPHARAEPVSRPLGLDPLKLAKASVRCIADRTIARLSNKAGTAAYD